MLIHLPPDVTASHIHESERGAVPAQSKDAAGRLPCTVFVGEDHNGAPYDTAIVDAGGMRDSGTGEGLDAGWQLLYSPPIVSLFSGAATYNHPLKLPPGRTMVIVSATWLVLLVRIG